MPAKRDFQAAEKERLARERGRTIPYYTRQVAKKLASAPKRGKVTPSKRAAK